MQVRAALHASQFTSAQWVRGYSFDQSYDQCTVRCDRLLCRVSITPAIEIGDDAAALSEACEESDAPDNAVWRGRGDVLSVRPLVCCPWIPASELEEPVANKQLHSYPLHEANRSQYQPMMMLE